jgi:hypothetical protein
MMSCDVQTIGDSFPRRVPAAIAIAEVAGGHRHIRRNGLFRDPAAHRVGRRGQWGSVAS